MTKTKRKISPIRLIRQTFRTFQILAILAVFTAAAYIFLHQKPAEAAWFNDNWMYRQIVAITNGSGSTQTDYQVQITMATNSLYSAGKIQIDCDDIRITDMNGKVLPYWIEPTTCNTASTLIWTKIPSIPTTGINLYIYYGNAGAPNQSSTTATFIREVANVQGAWKMDEANWGTPNCSTGVILDSSGNGYNGLACPNLTGPTGGATGKFNKAGSFDGSNDYATMGNILTYSSAQAFTISVWFNITSFSSRNFLVARHNTSYTRQDYALSVANNTTLSYSYDDADVGPFYTNWTVSTISTGAWHHFAVVGLSDGTVTAYYDGASLGNQAGLHDNYTSTVFEFGRSHAVGDTGPFVYLNGLIDEVRVYNAALSATEISDVYNNYGYVTTNYANKELVRKRAATEPSAGTPATEEQSPGPVASWKLEEGQGQTVNDSTQSANVGTLGATSAATTDDPTWTTEDMCVSGKCLKFDGSNDFVNVAGSIASVKSVSFWVKPISVTSTDLLVLNGAAGNAKLETDANGAITAGSDFTTPTTYVNGLISSTLIANKWQFVTVTTGTGITASNVMLGRVNAGYLNGFMDEIKLYQYTRTAAQVKTDYNSRNSVKGSGANLGNSKDNNLGALANGLVGWWKMDAASGDATDSSGIGTTLTNVSTTAYTTGKFGNSVDPDGAADYFYAADNATLSLTGDLTISTWINPDTVSAGSYDIAGKWDYISSADHQSYLLQQSADEIVMYIDSASTYVTTDAVNMTAAGGWYHVVATYKAASSTVTIFVNGEPVAATTTGTIPTSIGDDTDRFHVGAEDSSTAANNFYNGQIDDVRVYNRTLSTAEVRQLYNWAPGPVLNWNLNENTGTTSVNDTSGNGNTGTMTGTMTAADWVPGKFGSGLDLDGSNDALTIATASDSYVDFNGAEAFSGGAWVYIKTMPGSGNQDAIIAKWDATVALPLRGYRLYVENDDADTTGNFQVDIYDESTDQTITATGANDTVSQNTWYYIAFTFNGGTAGAAGDLKLYTNGTLTGSNSANASFLGLEDIAVDFTAGDYDTTDAVANDTAFTGVIDDIKMYGYARSAKQVVEDMNAGHPAPGSPVGSAVGYWKFDEGADNTCSAGVNDVCNSGSGGLALDGAESGMSVPATATSGWTNSGKFGKALSFDGTNDYVDSNTDNLFDFGTNDFTVSTWIKPTDSNANGRIVSKMATINSDGFDIMLWGGYVNVMVNNTWDVTSANMSYAAGEWAHLVWVKSGANSTVYKNGVFDVTWTDTPTTVNANAATLKIGSGLNSAYFFKGSIDEVKIYSFALTADEIKMDYNRGQAIQFGALSDNATYEKQAANQEYCVPGDATSCVAPVGEWKFDENTGSAANDYSGNNNNGVVTNPLWISGKFGSALGTIINGGSQNLATITDPASGILDFSGAQDFTTEAWVKSSLNESYLVIQWKGGSSLSSAGYEMEIEPSSHVAVCTYSDGVAGTETDYIIGTTNIQDGKWHMVNCVMDRNGSETGLTGWHVFVDGKLEASDTNLTEGSSVSANDLIIGELDPAYEWNGGVDEVRIYNYARTPAQIAWDYNRGGPVGWWKFDECTGGTMYDASGKGNNGTWYGTGSGQTSFGDCATNANTAWYNGRIGKYNSSLNFDGSDDYVGITDNDALDFGTGDFSISAWIKHAVALGASYDAAIFHKYGGAGGGYAFTVRTWADNPGKLNFAIRDNGVTWVEGVSTRAVNDNTWHHVVVSAVRSSVATFYIDGAPSGTVTISGQPGSVSNAINPQIGFINSYFNGQIDDVRVYNYALTATQIKLLYNQAAAVRFAPVTGTP